MTDQRKPAKPIVTGGPRTARPRKAAVKKPAPPAAPADQGLEPKPQIDAAPSLSVAGAAAPLAVAPRPARPMSPEEAAADRRARSRRNIVMALGLVAFIAIVYLVTVLKMGAAVAQRPF